MSRTIVIGGGAAGFFAAIAVAQQAPWQRVVILEAGAEPLRKVKISGGGRCNVTHSCFDPAALVQAYPRGGKALRGAFSRFQPRDTVAWFAERGVELKTEADGRIFPVSDDSETIIQCLRRSAAEAGVELRVRAAVDQVKAIATDPSRPAFQVTLRNGGELESDRILLASGSHPSGYQIAKDLGHHLIPPVPSLFTFNLDPQAGFAPLAGISVADVHLTLHVPSEPKAAVLKQSGDMLITHWGLSGPAILKLSAWGARVLHQAHYQAQLEVNWCGAHRPETVKTLLDEIKQTLPRKQLSNYRPLNLPQRLWLHLLRTQGIPGEKRWGDLSKKEIQRILQVLTQSRLGIQGKGIFKDEFVTCGGVDLKEINFKQMASRCCPGLFFAGEILDIDGVTGGFNFQSAWTTGWLAGQGMSAAGL